MSNNNKNKQPLTESLLQEFDKAQAPSTTGVPPGNGLGNKKIKNPVAPGIPSQPVEASISDVKPGTKNDSLGIPVINQPDVTTPNLSHSDEASTSTQIIDNQTPYYRDKSVDETIRFLLHCATRGENRGNQSPSICKVSRIHRDLSDRSFIPQLVSIGPIHREDQKLQEFEWLKGCYLNDLLKHCESTPKETLEECLQKVMTKIPQIRESYDGVKKNYTDGELARMMVMDGCFILEFCFKHENRNLYLPNEMQNKRIAMDLMLLENQVPFFVLQDLFDYLAPYIGPFTLSQVLDAYFAPYFKLFRSLSPEKNSTIYVESDSTYDHVLGYLHKRYQLAAAKSSNPIPAKASKHHQEDVEGKKNTAFHSIVELDRSGMNFKRHQEDEWSMKIEFHESSPFARFPWFWSKQTLIMPTLVIEDFTEVILRNFIAYEQSFPQDHRYYFTSYAHAMDKLIDTQEDIAKLVKSKVLVNNLGSNQEAADMINKVCKNISITKFYYTKEFKQMDNYYNRCWPKNIARLRRTYFSNPWSAIALIAAIILFSLTVVQTIYTIRAA